MFKVMLKIVTGAIAALCLISSLGGRPEPLVGAALFGILFGALFVRRAF